ncbi:MAG: hypothetical protein K2X99_10260 [Gemmatimonadaceae bacterium]|nr:hypothetical protein [Gemmatimonadaceae bacterium]
MPPLPPFRAPLPRTSVLAPEHAARLHALIEEGRDLFERFDLEVRDREFHPFIPADFQVVLESLLEHYRPGARFLEWGSGMGVITILADLVGYEASGIELDASLVRQSRALATKYESRARFAAASFFPTGYVFRPADGDARAGTLGEGVSGYLELGHPLEDFDVVFGYPWGGEAPLMHDLMHRYGRADALLLLATVNDGVKGYRAGRQVCGVR